MTGLLSIFRDILVLYFTSLSASGRERYTDNGNKLSLCLSSASNRSSSRVLAQANQLINSHISTSFSRKPNHYLIPGNIRLYPQGLESSFEVDDILNIVRQWSQNQATKIKLALYLRACQLLFCKHFCQVVRTC